jgi:hypothetical protein
MIIANFKSEQFKGTFVNAEARLSNFQLDPVSMRLNGSANVYLSADAMKKGGQPIGNVSIEKTFDSEEAMRVDLLKLSETLLEEKIAIMNTPQTA